MTSHPGLYDVMNSMFVQFCKKIHEKWQFSISLFKLQTYSASPAKKKCFWPKWLYLQTTPLIKKYRMRSLFPRTISVENLAYFVDCEEILNFGFIHDVKFITEDGIHQKRLNFMFSHVNSFICYTFAFKIMNYISGGQIRPLPYILL